MASEDSNNVLNGIAIIGLAGRFPGARNVEEFWTNLRGGVESISFFSDEQLLEAGVEPSHLNDPRYVKAKAYIEDVDLFDAWLFGYSPREAEIMDPQQRLFMECAWEALETAGYDSEKFDGSIGVFAGVSMNTYLQNLYSNPELLAAVGGFQTVLGNDKDFLPTHVSYKFNLKGPSVNVQTSCSTSLVAVHIACQNLLNYQCDMALAGGVSVTLPLKTGFFYQEGGVISPDGHCRTFDAQAQGTVAGNGLGIVVLKRLEDALRDGD
ncbi:MAG TPA: polyketide synthase, partial [Pyrinomonadaceae bacterium]|nr:polyketide synthase [Pyrinomonadaceae bacterium]